MNVGQAGSLRRVVNPPIRIKRAPVNNRPAASCPTSTHEIAGSFLADVIS
jgi:hypothetical protein